VKVIQGKEKGGKQPMQKTAMTQSNLKYVKGKVMLTTDQLRDAGWYCVKLHNYYIQNYKTDKHIMVQYKDHHILLGDDTFVITFYDLHGLFTLDALDISLMRYFTL
jgi:hypothetical protein